MSRSQEPAPWTRRTQNHAAARDQIGRSGTVYHSRQTGFGFEHIDLSRACCGVSLRCPPFRRRLPGDSVLLRERLFFLRRGVL